MAWLQNWPTAPLNCTDDKGLLPLSLIIRAAWCQWDTQRDTRDCERLHPSSHCPIARDLLQEAISQLSHLLGAFGYHGKLQKASIGHFNWQLRTTEALAWNQQEGLLYRRSESGEVNKIITRRRAENEFSKKKLCVLCIIIQFIQFALSLSPSILRVCFFLHLYASISQRRCKILGGEDVNRSTGSICEYTKTFWWDKYD